MRIYRDVELVESLGSGIPRILHAYGEECFKFTDNFIRITLPVSVYDEDHDSDQPVVHQFSTSSPPVLSLIKKATNEFLSVRQLADLCGLKDIRYFRKNYLNPALTDGAIERLYPQQPLHPKQKYRLTEAALTWKGNLMELNL